MSLQVFGVRRKMGFEQNRLCFILDGLIGFDIQLLKKIHTLQILHNGGSQILSLMSE
jgi:hypothetical protein